MSLNPTLLLNLAALAGAVLVIIQPAALGGSVDPVAADPAFSACHIEADQTPDGLLLTAWGRGDAGDNYRMVVTQRTGGGGFDIVQEGDVPLTNGEDALLSDMILDTDASFSARLSTWNAAGDEACSWNERV